MVAKGFVLVKTRPGAERSVYEALLEQEGVIELFPLFGEYDLILEMEAPSFDDFGQRLVAKVRAIRGVVRTQTLMATRM
jgi:DNA-binding Lrp family transcriptional regulator